MPALKAGDAFPEGVSFLYVVPTPENSDVLACGIPTKYDASKEFQDKKVVLVSVPGAFTPTCTAQHLPGYIAKLSELKAKGVDQVLFISYNDPFVQSAWGKANGIKDDSILFLTDDGASFSKSIGDWTIGDRTARYALVIDHGKVVYAEKEPGKELTVSSADAVLSKL
ncbi:peroxisomal matrix protein [Camillea tinctor]|nr:peroxisomal matrix protein [Camillea tinctor]